MKTYLVRFTLLLNALVFLLMLTLVGPQPTYASPEAAGTNKIEPALLSAMKARPQGQFKVIVQTAMPSLKSIQLGTNADGQKNAPITAATLRKVNVQRANGVMDKLRSVGGQRVNSLGLIGGSAATLTVPQINKLSREPSVKYIRLDRKMVPLGTPADSIKSVYTLLVRAPNVWAQGIMGQGIGVAVLDSGVDPVDDLMVPAPHIIASVDLVDPNDPVQDPGGHGTHVAGIIAGNGTDSASTRLGVAPGANIVDVRVIGSNGTTSLSTVIRGITWVIQHRRQYNIRVLNVSLGAPATVSYRDDPLSSAVEMAWASGIVVVTAAGNSGPQAGTIVTPGIDPFVITVGALDDSGTLDPSDDSIAPFSARGPTLDGLHKPDLVAPGRKIVSLRAPGSYLDNLLPDRITDQYYFRLSGTSMSAPVVAGTVAMMLQRTPALNPNLVKSILLHNARPVANTTLDSAGVGMVDAYSAVNSPLWFGANRGLTPSDEFCQAVLPILRGMSLSDIWRDPYYRGINWSNITWDNITWDRTTWENITWENITWDNITWDNITWDNITWDTAAWDAATDPGTGAAWDAAGDLD